MVSYGQLARSVSRTWRQAGTLLFPGSRIPIAYLIWYLEQGTSARTFVADNPAVELRHADTVAAVWTDAAEEVGREAARREVRRHVDLALLRETVGEMIAAGIIDLPEPPADVRSGICAGEGDGLTSYEHAAASAWIRRCVIALREGAARISGRPIPTLQAQQLAHRLNDLLHEAETRGAEF